MSLRLGPIFIEENGEVPGVRLRKIEGTNRWS
jgi:hypothetical protein